MENGKEPKFIDFEDCALYNISCLSLQILSIYLSVSQSHWPILQPERWINMSTYVMFGKYSQDSMKQISAKRTNEAKAEIEKNGGKLTAGYALLGEHDLVLIIDFPSVEQAIKTSVALAKLLGVSFSTSPAVTIQDFDRLLG